MSTIGEAVAALCDAMGLQSGAMPVEEHVAMEIEGLGALHLEVADEALIVYLSQPISLSEDRGAVLRAALEATHWSNGEAGEVQAAANDDALILLRRLDGAEVDLPVLEETVTLLGRMQEEVRA